MITVIETDSGSFNVIGVEDGQFIVQGNLTRDQLEKLKDEIIEALDV